MAAQAIQLSALEILYQWTFCPLKAVFICHIFTDEIYLARMIISRPATDNFCKPFYRNHLTKFAPRYQKPLQIKRFYWMTPWPFAQELKFKKTDQITLGNCPEPAFCTKFAPQKKDCATIVRICIKNCDS